MLRYITGQRTKGQINSCLNFLYTAPKLDENNFCQLNIHPGQFLAIRNSNLLYQNRYKEK